MYQKGEYVVKANNGICKIEDMVYLDMPGVDKKKQYYLLVPVNEKKTKLYVPVDADNTSLRPVMKEAEALQMIDNVTEIEEIWIDNDKQRETKYREAVQSCNPERLIGIIKNIYVRKQDRARQGKKNTTVDERYFKLAEDMLYSELAFATGREKTEIPVMITCQIEKKSIQ